MGRDHSDLERHPLPVLFQATIPVPLDRRNTKLILEERISSSGIVFWNGYIQLYREAIVMLAAIWNVFYRRFFQKTLVFYGISVLIFSGLHAPLFAVVEGGANSAGAFRLKGSYIYAGLNVNGTLGQGTSQPGLQYDATGGGLFR